jgi:hypothetical protein
MLNHPSAGPSLMRVVRETLPISTQKLLAPSLGAIQHIRHHAYRSSTTIPARQAAPWLIPSIAIRVCPTTILLVTIGTFLRCLTRLTIAIGLIPSNRPPIICTASIAALPLGARAFLQTSQPACMKPQTQHIRSGSQAPTNIN